MPLAARRQAVNPHGACFDLVDGKGIFAFAVDRFVGAEFDRLIFGRRGNRSMVVAGNRCVFSDRVTLEHVRRPPSAFSISNRCVPRYSRYPLRIATEARDRRWVYNASTP